MLQLEFPSFSVGHFLIIFLTRTNFKRLIFAIYENMNIFILQIYKIYRDIQQSILEPGVFCEPA